MTFPTLVCKFVHEFAKGDGVPQYGERQFVQGFQNMANPPCGTHEFCTVSLLNSIRHGTGWHHWTNEKTSDPEPFEQHLEAVVEHVVQIDMCSAEPYVLPQVTAERAQILQLVAGSNIATEYATGREAYLSSMPKTLRISRASTRPRAGTCSACILRRSMTRILTLTISPRLT